MVPGSLDSLGSISIATLSLQTSTEGTQSASGATSTGISPLGTSSTTVTGNTLELLPPPPQADNTSNMINPPKHLFISLFPLFQ